MFQVFYKKMGDFNALFRMKNSLLVLVHLRKQRADLHVRLALVLEELQA